MRRVRLAIFTLFMCARAWRYEQEITPSLDSASRFGHHLSDTVEFGNGTVMWAATDTHGVTLLREGRSYHEWKQLRIAVPAGAAAIDMSLSASIAVFGGALNNSTGFVTVLDPASGRVMYDLQPTEASDGFGQSVAVDCDSRIVAVGCTRKQFFVNGTSQPVGAVVVYNTANFSATPTTLSAPAAFLRAGALFGFSVTAGASGGRIAVGSPYGGQNCGLVYVFEKDTTGAWYLYQTLRGNDAAIGAGSTAFGYIVRLSCDGTVLAVGAPCIANPEAAEAGGDCDGTDAAAYVFVLRGQPAQWALEARHAAGGLGQLYGSALCIDTDAVKHSVRIAVAEPAGHVRIFDLGQSDPVADIDHRDAPTSYFGADIALRGDVLAIGAPNANSIHMYSVSAPSDLVVGGILAAVLIAVLAAVFVMLICYKLHPSTHLALSNASRV